MSNREKIQELEKQRSNEIALVDEKYRQQIKALTHPFTIQEIEADGWKRTGSYISSPGEMMYEKNGHSLRVEKQCKHLITYSGAPGRRICDMEDLEYYATTGQ